MKIGFVLDDSLDKSDGVQQYILSLGNYYRTKGHEVHYLVGETRRTDIPHIHSMSKNLQAHFNQNRMSTPMLARKRTISTTLADIQPDILHVQMPYSPLMAGRIIKQADESVAIVGTFHIVPFSWIENVASKTLGLALRRTNKRINAIYSVSKPAQRFARKTFNLKTSVMPNVVNVHQFSSVKPFPHLDDDTITIVFLGRLVERKGCMNLLEAIEKLHKQKRLSRVRVIICGKGPLLDSLQKFVAKNHLKHVVHFVGYVDEVSKARYLASADIAVFPSTGGESFGIVLLEAMAAGSRVVLAGDNVGYRSVMSEHDEQLLKPKDTETFAKILNHYIMNKSARNKAYTWQQKFVKNYDVNAVGSQLLKEYERIKDAKAAKS